MSDLLDLNSLSSTRFERICKAFLEIDTGKSFRTYTEGADGGIDIRYFANKRSKIIGQCKRYGRTTVARLFAELKNELTKITKIDPTEYYLFISCDLTPANEDKIFEMFEKYMPKGKTEHITHGKNIDDKLSKSKYRVICEENYDLFAKSKSLLDLGLNAEVINDSKTLRDEIKRDSKLFVRTSNYYDAAEKFFKSRNILITGEPGIGKTFLSKMLVSDFLKKHKNAEFHYSSCKNLASLNKIMNNDKNVYELFYLDDFLGRAYFELKENTLNELKYLLMPILKSKRKYVILNSRRSVLNDANEKMKTLAFSFDDSIFKMEYINISDLSYKDKGLILYKHIVVNKLDKPRIREIKSDHFYKRVIEHKSFFPRLIEFVTKPSYYSKHDVSDYKEMILEALDNPKDIYADDLNNNHREIDRIFLYLLRSFDCDQINEKLFEDYFNSCCHTLVKDFDDTRCTNHYADCLTKLNDCYVKEITSDLGNFLDFGNPSIIDYIDDNCLFPPIPNSLNDRLFKVVDYIDQAIFLKRGFLTSGKQYIEWYENRKKEYLTIKFPKITAKMFYYFNSDQIDSFDINDFIDFALNEEDIFTYPYTSIDGRSFYSNLFKKHDIDGLLCSKKLDSKTTYAIFKCLLNYFDGNELYGMLRKTAKTNKKTNENFAMLICENLFDQYMDHTDLSDILADTDGKYRCSPREIEHFARCELADQLARAAFHNFGSECYADLEETLGIQDYADDYASFVDFSNEIDAYFGTDDFDYEYDEDDYHITREEKFGNDEEFIETLFDSLED